MYNHVIIVYIDSVEYIKVCNEWQQVSLSPVSPMTNFIDRTHHAAQQEHTQM
jgi:hypothetical protein